jgi:hypothetical protein
MVRRVEQDRFRAWREELRACHPLDGEDPDDWAHMVHEFLESERRARIWRRVEQRMARRRWDLQLHATEVHRKYRAKKGKGR